MRRALTLMWTGRLWLRSQSLPLNLGGRHFTRDSKNLSAVNEERPRCAANGGTDVYSSSATAKRLRQLGLPLHGAPLRFLGVAYNYGKKGINRLREYDYHAAVRNSARCCAARALPAPGHPLLCLRPRLHVHFTVRVRGIAAAVEANPMNSRLDAKLVLAQCLHEHHSLPPKVLQNSLHVRH